MRFWEKFIGADDVDQKYDGYLGGATNKIGNAAKTSYNKLTGHSKFDNRPSGGTEDDYTIQVRSESAKTTGLHWGIDCETHLIADGSASLRSVQGVAVVDSGYTLTAGTLNGSYAQVRADGDVAGDSYLIASYALVGASVALTANHVASLWLDTHQAEVITGEYSLMYMTENGAEPLDQVIYLRTPGAGVFANFVDCNEFIGNGQKSGGTAKNIKIEIDGTDYWINAYPS